MIDWLKILTACGVEPAIAASWADAFGAEVQAEKFSLGLQDIKNFVAQVLHESNRLKRLEEDLYYRKPERLMAVWPARFPTLESAQPFVQNPQALANKVYGNRLGNTDTDDGWKYRGSGPIQVTGKANFQALQDKTGLPFVDHPELLRSPTAAALRVCVLWWEGNVPDAVMGDVRKVRRAVNGGEIGLDDTAKLTELVGRMLS